MNAYLPFKFFFLIFLGLFSRHGDKDFAAASTKAPVAMDPTGDETDPIKGSINDGAKDDMNGEEASTGGGVDTIAGNDATTVNDGTTSTNGDADTGHSSVVQQGAVNVLDLGGLLVNESPVSDLTDSIGLTGEEAIAKGGLLGDLIDDEGVVADLTDGLGLTGEEAAADGGLLGDLIGDEGLAADLTDGLVLAGQTTDLSYQVEPVKTPFLDLFPELSSLCVEEMEQATEIESGLAVALEASLAIEVDLGGDYTDLNAMFGLTALSQSDIPEDEDEDDEDLLFFL
ncbi:MAG: hypothetical protein O9289_06045 [Rhodobacteraceae bacterium]|nr:hypothetical protein [Paracoccaceae bacterium]MCZ8082749.1 hypothetical protein [Paracoccaceae bacterium]